MNRVIKFRTWGGEKMLSWELLDTWCIDYVRANNLPIMQFTGLLDKNGVEVYEGDIVSLGEIEADRAIDAGRLGLEMCQITFGDGSFHMEGYGASFNDDSSQEWEVIGNVFENPELLKV